MIIFSYKHAKPASSIKISDLNVLSSIYSLYSILSKECSFRLDIINSLNGPNTPFGVLRSKY